MLEFWYSLRFPMDTRSDYYQHGRTRRNQAQQSTVFDYKKQIGKRKATKFITEVSEGSKRAQDENVKRTPSMQRETSFPCFGTV
jgi:hypothetical protein